MFCSNLLSVRRRQALRPGWIAAAAAAAVITSHPAHAVRPFVTDDARIIDVGQVETENWFETVRADGKFDPAPGFNTVWGTSLTEWFEVLAGAGGGRNRGGGTTFVNPVIIGKVLLNAAEEGGKAGNAFSVSRTFDRGRGSMYDEGHVTALVGMTTWRFHDDAVNLHTNYGMRWDRGEDKQTRSRVYWGIGADIKTPVDKLQFVIETFAGDPFVVDAPKYAMQTGFRWMQSDYVQFDVTFGMEPAMEDRRRSGGYERSAQLGIRLLFDAFTPGGRKGNPEGARGLFGSR
jgi:hypothetical protein